jgi:hypothetical protein
MPLDLSLLICSTHTRYKTFGPRIQQQLFDQYATLEPDYAARVEILILTDNKTRPLGEKRNNLIDLAHGRYIQFIDDDDRIAPDMIRTVLEATDSGADTVTFLSEVTLNGGPPKTCRYSLDYTTDRNTADLYERMPNHICAVKRELATQTWFPQTAYREDAAYARQLRPLLRTEHHIPRILYHYDYDDATTETQQHLPGTRRRLTQRKPVADLVILANAATPALAVMTQHAIDTAIAGAHQPLNIIVIEQTDHIYVNARTHHAAGDFHLNRYANAGVGLGTADHIIIANNDLIFDDNWLAPLLAADHPVVSPKNPGDPRQAHLTDNTTGTTNGTHLSGWCFMIRRDTWYQIGGFDEDFTMWCCDDALIEQLKTINIQPMLVPASRVTHLVSATLDTRTTDRDELTWAQVERFNTKYRATKFAGDTRYQAWKQQHTVPA